MLRSDLEMDTGHTANVSFPLRCNTTPLCTVPKLPAATLGIAWRDTMVEYIESVSST